MNISFSASEAICNGGELRSKSRSHYKSTTFFRWFEENELNNHRRHSFPGMDGGKIFDGKCGLAPHEDDKDGDVFGAAGELSIGCNEYNVSPVIGLLASELIRFAGAMDRI